jgi:hypothetical protein
MSAPQNSPERKKQKNRATRKLARWREAQEAAKAGGTASTKATATGAKSPAAGASATKTTAAKPTAAKS